MRQRYGGADVSAATAPRQRGVRRLSAPSVIVEDDEGRTL
jgi:hypothetical protein